MAKISKIALIVLFLGALPGVASAANLYFSPSSGSHAVGTTLSVSIYVSSADQAMNAASGVISFPQDKLEVTSLSKSGSIFTLWVQEPSFSNNTGTVNLEGIVLNPGFTGAAGKIITANFRVKAAGVAALNFSSSSILANDGTGANILTSLGKAQFILGGGAETVSAAPSLPSPPGSALPKAPQISSSTHPDPNKWYALGDAKFHWTLPPGTTGVRLLVGSIPRAVPNVSYVPAISEKNITQLTDGVWYFHAQLRNAKGWGEVSHFRFQIDTTKPEFFTVNQVKETTIDNGQAKFNLRAQDKTSGIDHYEIQVDALPFEVGKNEGSEDINTYQTPILLSGKHTLTAKAQDKAGNYAVASTEFIIKGLEPPMFTRYPRQLSASEKLMVKGSTYPDSEVTIWIQKNNEEPKRSAITSDTKGEFTVIEEKLDEGFYTIWAEVSSNNGIKSSPSQKITINVGKSMLWNIASWIIGALSLIIPIIGLLALLVFVIWYSLHRFSLFKKRLQQEIRVAEHHLHRAFRLREALKGQIQYLERAKTKRALTQEESKILAQLTRNLEDAEQLLRREIEDIEKEIK